MGEDIKLCKWSEIIYLFIHLFMFYITTLSVAQLLYIYLWLLLNDKLGPLCQEEIIARFKDVSTLASETEEIQEELHSG
jgi:hypothetical protein